MGEDLHDHDEIILYRPVYSCVPHEKMSVTNTKSSSQKPKYSHGVKDDSDNACEEINIVNLQHRKSQKSLKKNDSDKSGDRLRPEVVIVDEVSSAEPWEVVALNK